MTKRKSDERIRRDIVEELAWDSRVGRADIHVAVQDGVATLTGVVDAYAKKHAAQEAAHQVAGVTDVANEVEVKRIETRAWTDAEIAREVRHALEWDVMVPDRQIQTTVSDGWVTLDGTVERLREREDAEGAVRPLAGVLGVLNRITVSPGRIDPGEVSQLIESVLARRAHREANGIDVRVRDSVVTLSGQVRSWPEKQAILGAVGHARGIVAVDDRMRVDPEA